MVLAAPAGETEARRRGHKKETSERYFREYTSTPYIGMTIGTILNLHKQPMVMVIMCKSYSGIINYRYT